MFAKILAAFNSDFNQEFMKHIYLISILYFKEFVTIFIKILLQNLHVLLNSFALEHFLKCSMDFKQKYFASLFQFSHQDY